MSDVNRSNTHAKNFRFDADKEYDWNASVAIRSNQNFAPNDNSKLVEQLDELSALVLINKLIVLLFFHNLAQHVFGTFLYSLFFILFFIELNTEI
jgi:hypothetical protein